MIRYAVCCRVNCGFWPRCPCGEVIAGPLDPWDPGSQPTDPEGVDEEDDVYEPEDYTGDYPLEDE